MSSRRRRRTPKVDRISALPDSVICHILSLLPTKLSVSTSILSKRWKPLWKSVPNLNFDNESLPNLTTFRHFIDSIIVSWDPTLTLRSFRIRFSLNYEHNPHDLNRFVNAALQRRIEIFELDMSYSLLYRPKKLVPTLLSVFSCNTLVVLKLRCLMVHEVPHLVHLPLLKSLHLEGAYFRKLLHFMNLLRGCPILEELDTTDVEFYRDDNRFEGEFKGIPNLVRANLYYLIEETFPLAWLHNTKFLCVELITNYEYRVPTFHNLTHMKLIFNYDKRLGVEKISWDGKWKWVIQVLQHCPKLQSLTIDEASDYEPGDKKWMEPKEVPECLSSHLRICSLSGYKGHECELQFAEYIMLNSKLMCTMTIKRNCEVDGNVKHQMLAKLSACPMGSETCKLLFD